MANLDSDNFNEHSVEEPKPLEDKPIPFDDSDETNVSYKPLQLGRATASEKTVKSIEQIVSEERITGVKTFFTKLHAGSISFLSEQIDNWLKKNPGIVIKQTNTTTGMVIGKKTEPNIIITIWY